MSTLEFRGIHAEILADMTPEISAEGGRGSGKTTVCLWKELEAAQRWPGIWSYVFRYSDQDTKTKLRPELERLCTIRGEDPKWNNTELCYEFENESKIFCYGLKSVDLLSRYSKMRGLAVSRVFCDQGEELTEDLATELRAVLRPDPSQRLKHHDYPRQLVFASNPMSTRHWLATQFPESNKIPRRRYYCLSLYSNAHNLPADMIAGLEAAFPPDHPRYRSMVLGKRGPNVIGEAIYAGLFRRDAHIRTVTPHQGQFIEAFCTGKNCPCWVLAQRTTGGSLQFLGGIIGSDMFLTDFLPIVQQHRKDWLGADATIRTCAAPSGEAASPRFYSDLNILRDHGFKAHWREGSNAPDQRLSMIEYLADAMRRRTYTGEESLAVNDQADHWLEASREGVKPCPFLAEGFEVGYVKDEHFVSVGHKEVRQPKADDWFEHGMKNAEYLVLNFCAGQRSPAERDALAQTARTRNSHDVPPPSSPTSWMGS